jgi:hypothetical protein
MSVVLLLLGSMHFVQEYLSWRRLFPDTPLRDLPIPLILFYLFLSLVPLVLLIPLLAKSAIVGWLKKRVTGLGSGHAPRREEEFRQYPEMLLFCLWAVTLNLDASFGPELPWISLIALAAGLGFLWGRFGFSPVIPVLALSGILLAVLVASLSLSNEEAVSCLLITLGLLYLVKGAVELHTYLVAHPALPA